MKLILLLSLLLTFQFTHAQDVKNGEKLFKKINCAQCHKKDGMGLAKMVKGKLKINAMKGPRIAGLDAKYIVEQMLAVQAKKRTKNVASMRSKIKKYTEQDFKDLAAYVSTALNPKAGKHKGMLEK